MAPCSNEGTINVAAGTGTAATDQYFVNDNGTINLQSGNLDFGYPNSYEGLSTFTAAAGSTIDLGGTGGGGLAGSGTINGTLTGTGPGTVQLNDSVTIVPPGS